MSSLSLEDDTEDVYGMTLRVLHYTELPCTSCALVILPSTCTFCCQAVREGGGVNTGAEEADEDDDDEDFEFELDLSEVMAPEPPPPPPLTRARRARHRARRQRAPLRLLTGQSMCVEPAFPGHLYTLGISAGQIIILLAIEACGTCLVLLLIDGTTHAQYRHAILPHCCIP